MLRDCPLTRCEDGFCRPILNLRIHNPHTNLSVATYGIIDTGADECSIPAEFAAILGHDLLKGTVKSINTGNGVTQAYSHTTTLEIYSPVNNNSIYRLDNVLIDFLPNLQVVLLGVKSFLSNFILTVDYPQKKLSIIIPKKSS